MGTKKNSALRPRNRLLPVLVVIIIIAAVILILGKTSFSLFQKTITTQNTNSPTSIQKTKAIPTSYQITNVSYYSRKNFCYEASMMMQLKYSGLTEQEVQNFKKILDVKGKGGPPDAFIGLKELNLIPKVRLAYSKNYNQKFDGFYKQTFGLSNSQIINLANSDEALLYLKQLVSSNIPVGALIQKGNHYVVVTGYDQSYIYISDPDPDFGIRKMTINDFVAEWANYKQDIHGDQIGFPGELGMIWLEK